MQRAIAIGHDKLLPYSLPYHSLNEILPQRGEHELDLIRVRVRARARARARARVGVRARVRVRVRITVLALVPAGAAGDLLHFRGEERAEGLAVELVEAREDHAAQVEVEPPAWGWGAWWRS